MHSLWFLPAMVLAVPVYCVLQIRRTGTHERRDPIPSNSQPSTQPAKVPESTGGQARLMKWISIGEFMEILAKRSDLIVIDLRADAKRAPFPVPDVSVLPIAPDDLTEVLEGLPADTSVAFCGASNLCIFLIATSRCLEGSAPFYVLEGDLGLEEVA